jgi:hypothetical protein
MHILSSEVGDVVELSRDYGSSCVPTVSSFLRFKDLKHLTLRNANDPTTVLVWLLKFKAEVCNTHGFNDFRSSTSACSAQHHASVLSKFAQLIHEN